jgi:hypothetical protein
MIDFYNITICNNSINIIQNAMFLPFITEVVEHSSSQPFPDFSQVDANILRILVLLRGTRYFGRLGRILKERLLA